MCVCTYVLLQYYYFICNLNIIDIETYFYNVIGCVFN